jgi:hypothetical protein
MRTLFVLILLVLSGCGWSSNLIATAVVGANVGSVATIQRTVPDAVYSLVTGSGQDLLPGGGAEAGTAGVLHAQSGVGELLGGSRQCAGVSVWCGGWPDRTDGGAGGEPGAAVALVKRD